MGRQSREELELAVWESERRFEAIVQASPMGMHLYRLTEDGQLVFAGANPAADRILGVDNSQFVGQTIEVAFPALADTDIPERYRAVCRDGGTWHTEQIAYEDARIVGAFEVHAFPIGQRAMAALFLDITDRRLALQALHDSEEEHRRVVEIAPYSIATLDLSGNIVRCNLATARQHGFDNPGELVGHSILDLVAPEDRGRVQRALSTIATSLRVDPTATRLKRRDGATFEAFVSAAPLKSEAGQPRGVVVIARDATEELREARLLELQRDLALRLNSLTSVEPALELCLETAIEATSLDAANLYLVDRETGALRLAAGRGISAQFRHARRGVGVPADSPLGEQTRRGTPSYVTLDELSDPSLAAMTEEGLHCGGAIPVLHEGHPIACLTVGSRTCDEVRERDRHVVESIAAQLGGVIARLRAAEALQTNEEQYRLLVENQHDLVAQLDPTGQLLFVSPSYCTTFGRDRDELLGHSFMPLVHEADRPAVTQTLQKLLAPPHTEYLEHRAATREGWRWLAWQSTAVLGNDDEVREIISVGRDITARKKAEQALRYRSEFEALVLDISTRFINVSTDEMDAEITAALELLQRFASAEGGYLWRVSPDEATCRMQYAVGEAALETRERLPAEVPFDQVGPWQQALRAGQPMVVTDVEQLGEDATIIKKLVAPAGVRSVVDVPLRYGDKLHGFVGFLSRTPRDWSEDELSLLRLVAQVFTSALRRQADEAALGSLHEQLLQSQKMEAIGRLAGGVAHDFNNLLTGITGYTEMALSSLTPDDPLQEDLEEVLAASRRAASLTGQLLAFSRRQIIHPQVLNLNQVVRRSQKMLARIIGEDIELSFAASPQLGAVRTDPAQVDQVLVNLATNSRDAMPRGGQLHIETRNVTLDDEYARLHSDARAGDYVVLAVSDSGEGMDAETRRRVFEPFFSTKEKGKGTGLGLATVYGIVRQNEGFIDVYSEPGLGTTIKIYYPRVEQTAISAPPQQREPIPGGNEVILLVEDESMVRDLARRILTRHGYQVIDAPGGGDAFLLAEREPGRIDLLLTDVVMPKMNGRELYDRLRQTRVELRVVFMSGYTDDIIAQHGVLDPDMTFVQKPFAARDLLKAVRQALDAKIR